MYLNVTPIKNLKVNTKESYPKASFGALLLEHSTLQPKSRTCSKVQCLLARENRAEDEEMLPTCGHFRQQLENYCLSSVHFSRVRLLRPHGLQHTRLPFPSPTPGACSKSWPLSQWCHSTIILCVPFFSRCQSFPASGSFLMSQFFASGGQMLEFQLQHQSFQWTLRTDL